ncbi:MAG: hypothetical protein PHQ98_01030 [Candidatus ainarchaeum sp.]|nr:hypothetical protein [Candidatus ainarchaeum sp.]
MIEFVIHNDDEITYYIDKNIPSNKLNDFNEITISEIKFKQTDLNLPDENITNKFFNDSNNQKENQFIQSFNFNYILIIIIILSIMIILLFIKLNKNKLVKSN